MRDHVARKTEHAPAEQRAGLVCDLRLPLQGPAGQFDLDVSLSVERGEFVAVIGPSGAGKTTLLRLIAGLTPPASGLITCNREIWCDTAQRVQVPTRSRSVGFVFQDYALFPNMTVRGNIEYAMGRGHARKDVDRLLELVDLAGLHAALPDRLSGGQRQRLALVRALARCPTVLMLDEPLSALDWGMRRKLQEELRALHQRFETTTFLVSHDPAEVMRLSDRVIRLEEGRVVYDGDPVAAFADGTIAGAPSSIGEHVSGPDEAGWSSVMIDGRACRVRYQPSTATFERGERLMLTFENAQVTSLHGSANGRSPATG